MMPIRQNTPSLPVRYFHKPAAERGLLREALWLLALTRFKIAFLPFRVLHRSIRSVHEHQQEKPANKSSDDMSRTRKRQAQQIARTVLAVSRRLPWNATCLVQAASAKIMLNRRGVQGTLYLGVAKNSCGRLVPHAWLESGGKVLLGGDEIEKYTVVSTFD